MTVFQARVSEHLNTESVERTTVSLYAGPDGDNLAFAGHLALLPEEVQPLLDHLAVGRAVLGKLG